MRILLIEDDVADVETILAELQRTELETSDLVRVASLDEAIRALQKRDFDVVLLDLTLPGLEGAEAVDLLVRSRPELPIVVLTADQSFAAECLRLGAQDHLMKHELHPLLLERSLVYAHERKRHENEIIELSERLEILSQRLSDLAMSDALTGLGNRRSFDRHLDEEIRRASRQGGTVGLMLIDLDRFKEVNDGHGHEVGDRVLVTVGRALTAAARRAGERAFRIGGDEFALITACDPDADLGPLAARVVRYFTTSRPIPEVTLSLGSALLEVGESETKRSLSRRADRALYAAKNEGGDRHMADGRVEAERH